MKTKKTIALFFGGMGNEHEISISSAKNIAKYFDYKKYKLLLVYWGKDGEFYLVKGFYKLEKYGVHQKFYPKYFSSLFEIAFPVTHGKYGEDGILQGIFEWAKMKYTGCKVLSSALCMDKGAFKKFSRQAGFRITPYFDIAMDDNSRDAIKTFITEIEKKLQLPVFVKPANSGSSIGITKVDDFRYLKKAINGAWQHDSKIIVEQGLKNPREIEVAVLGNDFLTVSEPGELVPAKEFYDHEDKYVLNKTQIKIPADLNAREKKEIMWLAEKAYRLCNCRGYARVDFFISGKNIYLNEINTLPGFTDISMFPMLMKQSGISYRELINTIIMLAI